MDVHPDDEALRRLREEFVGWQIWRAVRYDGQPGEWVATRGHPRAGVSPTVVRSSKKHHDVILREVRTYGQVRAHVRVSRGRLHPCLDQA